MSKKRVECEICNFMVTGVVYKSKEHDKFVCEDCYDEITENELSTEDLNDEKDI